MNIHLNFLLIIFCIYLLQPTNAYYYTLSSPLNWNWLTWSGQTSSTSANETTKKGQYLLTERERGWLSVLANTILGVSRRRMIASSTNSIHRMAHVGRSMASTIDQTQTKQPTETIKQNIIVPTQSTTEMISEYSTINYGNIVEHDQQTTMGFVSEYYTTKNYENILMEHDQQSTIVNPLNEIETTPTTMIKMKNPVFRLFNPPIEGSTQSTTTMSSIFEPNSERSIETTTPSAEMSDTTIVGDTKENETRSPKHLPFIVPYYDGQNFESNFQNIYSDSKIFNDLMVMNSNANLDQHELSSKIDGVESVGSLTNYQHLDSSWFIGNNQDK